MQRLLPWVFASSAILASGPVPARDYICLDRAGSEVVQNEPCAEVNTQFRTRQAPRYVWAIVGVLGVAWVLILMPARLLPWRREGEPGRTDHVWGDPQPGGPTAPARMLAPMPHPTAIERPRPALLAAPDTWSLEVLARLSPSRFDELVTALWQANGYKAVPTGLDVKIHSPNGSLFAVAQRAPSPTEVVSSETLARIWSQLEANGSGLGILYGIAGFATDAVIFAQGKRLKLVSGEELLAQIRSLKAEHQQALLEHAWRHSQLVRR